MELLQIRDIIESFGSDSLEVVGGRYEGGIRLQQVPDEIASCVYAIMNAKRSINEFNNFLEIGSASGGNAYLFNHFFGFDNVIIIDDNRHKSHIFRKDILKRINYAEFIGDSHSGLAYNFIQNLGMHFDVIFIDGDHSYEGVKKDTEMYLPFVKYEGFIVYHDTVASPGVHKYFEELKDLVRFADLYDLVFMNEFISKTHNKPCGIGLFQSFELPRG
ncbi:MAG: class I SAM-dependent methyltransferase [Candidatus Hodarchaeales archaeon]|jgi:predicted O-methyltransferase YrrM